MESRAAPLPARGPAEAASGFFPGDALERALDLGLAGLGLILSAPLWVAVPLAVKLEDGGPVFYTEDRVGRGGEPFACHKFRSMAAGEAGRGERDQARAGDGRVTGVGRLLRRTALDELPQLLNVLKGEMSLVGPRPLLPREVEARGDGEATVLAELPGFRERHSVRPGLTGLAQVHASRELPHRKKFRYDLLYVRNRSLALDLKLIVRSVWISLRGAWPEVSS